MSSDDPSKAEFEAMKAQGALQQQGIAEQQAQAAAAQRRFASWVDSLFEPIFAAEVAALHEGNDPVSRLPRVRPTTPDRRV
jgi:hypothetical protein